MSCQPAVSQTQGRSVATGRIRDAGGSANGMVSVFMAFLPEGAGPRARRRYISMTVSCPRSLDPDQGLRRHFRAIWRLRAAWRTGFATLPAAPFGEISFMAVAGYADPAAGHLPERDFEMVEAP